VERPPTTRQISLALRALLQAGRDLQTSMARRLGIGPTDVQAMNHLVSSGQPLGPVELGHRLGIRSASATVLVDRLEAAGHLTRERHPADRRRITLHPTDSAKIEVRAAIAPLIETIGRIADRLDEDQARTVLAFLTEATDAVREFAAEPSAEPPQAD
jgi:DNA-binding MarR family transcriptional regulator